MLYIYKYIYIIQEINVKTKIISPLGTDKKRDADNIKKKKQKKKNKKKTKKQVHQNKINLVAKSH